jgi:hypothetical protein
MELLSRALADLPASEEAHGALSDAAAQLLRDISVEAWNQNKDGVTSAAALKLAMNYARSKEMKDTLYNDFTTLTRLTSELATSERKKKLKVLGWAAAGIAFLVWVSGIFDDQKPPPAASNTPTSPASYPQQPAQQEESQRTYQVPNYAVAELEGDQAAIEVQKATARDLERQLNLAKSEIEEESQKADALEARLEQLKSDIDREEPFVDSANSYAVASFNAKVNQYNSLVRQARSQRARANRLVDPYNTLVSRVNAQNQTVNQLVDAYNAKLHRVGH